MLSMKSLDPIEKNCFYDVGVNGDIGRIRTFRVRVSPLTHPDFRNSGISMNTNYKPLKIKYIFIYL